MTQARFLICLSLTVVTACGDDPSPPALQIERVSIGMDVARARAAAASDPRPAWDLQGTWVVTDVRDAFTAAIEVGVVRPITITGAIEISTAAALLTPDGRSSDVATLEFELRSRTISGERVLASSERTIHDAIHAWTELLARVEVAAGEKASFVLVAHARKKDPSFPPSALAGLRVGWSMPRVVPASPSKRNVLVLSVDTLRADHLGAYGYARATSPNIDALLARGARFESAISTAPWTLPSYGTLFTGLSPARHRAGLSTGREGGFGQDRDITHGDFEALSPAPTTLAESFRSAGFATAGIVSNPYFDSVTQIDRGFAIWIQYLNRAGAGVEIAELWLERRGETPWFLFLHLVDPHGPYAPPPPFDERFSGRNVHEIADYPPSLDELRAKAPNPELKKLLVDMYDGEIAYVDSEIGKLMKFLEARGELERTLIVFHADHGEEFWEHGSCEHGLTLFDEVLRVPLGFVLPGRIAPGTIVKERTSVVDVFPTILDLCRIEIPVGLDGRSVADACLGHPMSERPCFSEALLYGPRELKGVSTAGESFITDGASKRWLFDLSIDPSQAHDLARERSTCAQELAQLLASNRARAEASSKSTSVPAPDAARDARLRALGYPGADRDTTSTAKPPR